MSELVYSRMLASVSYKDHPYAKDGDLIMLTKKERRRIRREQPRRPKYISATMDVWRVAPDSNSIVGMVCIGRKQRKWRKQI